MKKRKKKLKRKKYSLNLNKTQEQKFLKTLVSQQALSLSDRITYAYIINTKTNETIEVTNVSYEVEIEKHRETIVHYDSEHGYLHKHIKLSLFDDREIITRGGVVKKGNPKRWLTWAIEDIQKNFYDYRRLFFKRSKVIDNYY